MVYGMGIIEDGQNKNLDLSDLIDLSETKNFDPSEITLTKSVKENLNSTAVSNGIHDLVLGYLGSRDKLLVDAHLHAPGRRFFFVKKNILYTQQSSYPRYNITAINVQDLGRNGTGGYPRLIKGGIRQQFAALSITSQRSQGLYYRIRIWGR